MHGSIRIACLVFLAFQTQSVAGFLPANPLQSAPKGSPSQLFGKSKKKKKPSGNTIAVNRQARRNYEVLETMEAGISLVGTEVKSIRDGKMNLRDGYVRPTKDGRSCILYNVHIGKHSMSGGHFQHEKRLAHKARNHAPTTTSAGKGL